MGLSDPDGVALLGNTLFVTMDLLCSLDFVACFRSPEGQPVFGSYGHLQRAEIEVVLQHPYSLLSK